MPTPTANVKVTGPLNLASGQVLSQPFTMGLIHAALVLNGPLTLANGKSLSVTFNLTATPVVPVVGFVGLMGMVL